MSCSCGSHRTQSEHEAQVECLDPDGAVAGAVEASVLAAMFPEVRLRRRFLAAVGAGTAAAALSSLFPLGAAKALAQTAGALEKKEVTIGFLPITCATPLIVAEQLGLYGKQGLKVNLAKTPSWALVRDKVINREFDASQMLTIQPLAASVGVGSAPQNLRVGAVLNTNGNALVLAARHKDRRDPKTWKGMRFGIPFEFSIHALLLRHYLAAHGVDPDKDVSLRVFPPPDFISNLKSGNLDGGLFAEPFNQRAVYEGLGFIHVLSGELWPGHPCCGFTVSDAFIRENPNTFAAIFRSVVAASSMAQRAENRGAIIDAIAPPAYLNQPAVVLEQVLTGRFADGLGTIRNVPSRIDFAPFPWQSMAVWILTQLKRWGYVKSDFSYREVAEKVFLAADARKKMQEVGLEAPASNYRKHVILGKEFDWNRADDYLKGLPFRRT